MHFLRILISAFFAILLFLTAAFPSDGQEKRHSYDPKVADLVIQGSIHELNGRHARALSAFNEALIYEPLSASISYAVAKQYIYLGKVETAIEVLSRALRIDHTYIKSHLLLAEIYHRKGKITQAEKHYLLAVQLDSTDFDANNNLALIYNARKEYKQAAFYYERLVRLGHGTGEIQFMLGNLYFEIQDYDRSLQTFQEYLESYPDVEQGYLAVGLVMLAQKDTLRALDWYRKTYGENKNFGSVRDEIANTLIDLGDWEGAVQIYEEAAADSNDVISRLRLGELYMANGDTNRAIETYERITQTHPKEWRAPYQLGIIYFLKLDWEQCIAFLQSTVDINKSWPDAWFRLGLAYQQQGQLSEAEESFREAQKLAPIHAGVNVNLGFVLFQQQKFEDAIEYLMKAAENAPDSSALQASALTTIADVYEAMQQHDKSEEYYQQALAIDPENPTILNNYSYSLAQRNERLGEALEMVKKALEKDPDNGAFLDTMGWVYFKMTDFEQALTFIKRALEIRNNSAEVHEHLGDVYDKLGETELAVQSWQQARELEPDRQSVLLKLGIN